MTFCRVAQVLIKNGVKYNKETKTSLLELKRNRKETIYL